MVLCAGWEQRSSALDVVPNAEESYIKFIVQEKQDKQAAKVVPSLLPAINCVLV